MASNAPVTPHALARKFFLLTMFGLVLYVGFVFAMMSAPDKAETDQQDVGAAVAYR